MGGRGPLTVVGLGAGPPARPGPWGLGPRARPCRVRSLESGSSRPLAAAHAVAPRTSGGGSRCPAPPCLPGRGARGGQGRAPSGHRVSRGAPRTSLGVPDQLFPVGRARLELTPARSDPFCEVFLISWCLSMFVGREEEVILSVHDGVWARCVVLQVSKRRFIAFWLDIRTWTFSLSG